MYVMILNILRLVFQSMHTFYLFTLALLISVSIVVVAFGRCIVVN